MNYSNIRIGLDIHKACSGTTVYAKRGDIGRRIHISLTDGGIPYRIGEDCTAVFTAEKPDGNVVYNGCTIQGDTIIYDMTEQTTAVLGRVDCEIKLYGADGKLITSPGFNLIVSDTVYDAGDEVESTSEFSALTAAMTELAELKVNGLKGDDGASAYDVAVAEGFEGTKEEWLESLVGPRGPQGEPGRSLRIAITTNPWAADKTFAEIYAAHEAGQVVECVLNDGRVLPLVAADAAGVVFQSVLNREYQRILIKADNSVTYTTGQYALSSEIVADFTVCVVENGDGSGSSDVPVDDIRNAYDTGRVIHCELEMQDQYYVELPFVKMRGGIFYFAAICDGVEWLVKITADEAGETAVTVTQRTVGAGSGGAGEDGGYYTPAVVDNGDGTMTVSFEPTKEEMDAVDPVTLPLPAGKGISNIRWDDTSGNQVTIHFDYTDGGSSTFSFPIGQDGISAADIEPAEDDVPKVFITGVKPTTKDDVLAEMQYISKTENFHAYLKIKCQGTSSMSWDKKNFTVKLYSDESRETKLKKSFKDWGLTSNKYVLKANYIDHSHARNIVSARLWNEVVKSRPDYDTLPVEMRSSPRNGAVDGFPVKVYYNGTYEGIYTWNIGKDAWMWGMDDDNLDHVLLCAESNAGQEGIATACNFRTLWDGVDENHWSVEVGTNSDAVKTSLNNLIQFIIDNDGDAFRNSIGQHLDIQSAIDYYIFQYEICGLDGLGKNMLLATYDGKIWRCGAYDLDSTFGLWWNGSEFVSATYACPEDYEEPYSLLWERIEANYRDEMKARQAELRKTVLSYHNMVTHFERFMDTIGLDLYAEDLTIYESIPSGSANNIQQIRNFIRDRQVYVDTEFAAMGEPVPCTGITLSATELTFTEAGSQTLVAAVTPENTTDTIIWASDNNGVATVDGGVVTAVANGSCCIIATCGEYSAVCDINVSDIFGIDSAPGIRSTGTQYIDTGITPTQNTAVEVACRNPTEDATYENIFGTIPDGMGLCYANGWLREVTFCGNCIDPCDYDVYISVGQDCVVRLDGLNKKLTANGKDIVLDTSFWEGTASATNTMLLFNKYIEGEIDSAYGLFILYYFKVWENGELIQHLVPHIDAEGVVCLYDNVSGECFYNQGTGEFEYV